MTNAQVQRERWYLSKFRDTFTDLPRGEVRRGTPPEPDFVVESGPGETIGIEVTELYHDEASGSSFRVQESEQIGVVRAACSQLEEAGVEPLNVAVHFASQTNITKRHRAALSSRIASLVSERVPTSEGTAMLLNGFDGSFPESVLAIRVSRVSVSARHHWSVPMSGYLRPDFVDDLQARITAKARRHKSYRRAIERCWLLVVANGFAPSSLFDPSGPALSHVYESPFERTFFLEAFSGRRFELQTRAETAPPK